MTDTQTVQRPFFGQQLGETTREARVLLDAVLNQEGTTFQRWVALNTLGTQGPAVPLDLLQRDLGAGLQMDLSSISSLLAQLDAEGVIETSRGAGGPRVALTAAGASHYQHIRQVILNTSARVLAGIDPDELQTTFRVLAAVKERAQALQAS